MGFRHIQVRYISIEVHEGELGLLVRQMFRGDGRRGESHGEDFHGLTSISERQF